MKKFCKYRKLLQKWILFIVFFMFLANIHAQNLLPEPFKAASFELKTPLVNIQQYEASNYINLVRGFSYSLILPNSILFYAKIDETIIAPHPYQNEVDGSERPINTNYAVGSLPGSFDVTSSGSATYSVPIEVSPGTNGMVPGLSINYSSSSGSGILGMGFDLGGFSTISRTGKDIFHDGITSPVNFDNENDKFILDGERLLLYSGTYGVTGSEYRPESQYYTKVLLLGNGNNMYFEVWTKDGLIKEYGYTDESRIERNAPNTSGVYTWQLTKIKDYYGNYIKYNYHKNKSDGEYYIESIVYTGNDITGMQPYNEVKFFYDYSNDQNTTYSAGSVFKHRLLLRKIKTFCEGKLVKLYQFKYAINDYSHLNEIILAAGDGTRINSTVINWGPKITPTTTVFDEGHHGTINDDLYKYKDNPTYFTDINGDGVKELLVLPVGEICNQSTPNSLKWQLFKYDLKSSDKKLISIADGCMDMVSYVNGGDTINRNNMLKIVPFDIDLDGKDELLFLTSVTKVDEELTVLCRAFKFDENYNLKKFDVAAFQNLTFCSLVIPAQNELEYNKPFYNNLLDYSLHIADFNGDGFIDFLYRTSYMEDWTLKSFKRNNNQWSLVELGNWNLYNLHELMREDYINAGDFDGDGIAELLWANYVVNFTTINNTTTWSYSSSQGLYNLLYDPDHNSTGNTEKYLKDAKTGDFNGDGITDVIFHFQNYTENTVGDEHEYFKYHTFEQHWHIAYGKGEVAGNTDFIVRDDITNFKDDWSYAYQYIVYYNEELGIHQKWYEGTNHRLYVADINSDGKSDIIDAAFLINSNPNTGKEQTGSPIIESWIGKILISDGYSFKDINPNQDYILYKDENSYYDYPKDYYIFNDFTLKGNLQIFDGLRSYDVKPGLTDQKVVSFVNGFNSKTKIEYNTLMDDDIYTMGTGASFPLIDKTAPISVVSKVAFDNGTSEGANVEYKYEGLKIHNRGKGSLGFFKNTITNLLSQQKKENTYEIANNTFYDKVLKSTVVENSGSDQILSESIMTNFVQSFPLGGWYIIYNYPSEVINMNYLTNSMSTSQSSYDMYMNITSSNSAAKQIGAANNEWYSYSIYGPYTIINNSNYWLPGLLTNISTTTTKGQLPPVSNTSSYTYYDNGSLQTKVNEPTNENKTTTTYLYDDYGNTRRYEITGKSNIAGNQEIRYMDFVYDDPKHRFLTIVINSKGHNALFTFDPCFGSALTTTDANSNLTKFTYDAFGRTKTVTTPDNNIISASVEWITGQANTGLYKIYSTMPAIKPIICYYDRLMRPVRMESKGFNGETLYKDYSYNEFGYRDKESLPYFSQNAGNKQNINFNYDPLTSRLMTVQGPAVDIAYTYAQNKTTLTDNILGVSSWILTDAAGNITQSHDNGGTINFVYNSQGLIKSITDPSNNISLMEYDIFGNQTSLTDPDAGTTSYTYDAFGQLLTQTDARGATTQMGYDEFGRLVERKESMNGLSDFKTTNYTYDTKTKGLGMLSMVSNSDGYAEEFNYDLYSRPINSKTTIDNVEYTKSIVYDKLGRVKQFNYPSGFGIKYNYNQVTGDLVSMIRTDNNQSVWQCSEVNALGQIEKYVLGNGLITRNMFDQQTHMLTDIKTGTENNWYVQNLSYLYNSKLQIYQRKDNRNSMLIETFTYDDLNRLTSSQVKDKDAITVSYDINGNITGKSDVGTYNYELPKPHALKKIFPYEGITPPENDQNITYNEFNKVSSITEGTSQLYYTYGANQQRIKSELYQNEALVKRKYYLGNYEKEITNGVTRELHYISAPSGLVGIMERKNGENKMYYVHSDMLGSFNSITDENGNIVEEMNFDAWGKRRNPTDWSYDNIASSFLFDRGYTGHEHLDAFGLINMNGRMYDPNNARFLSPDPFVQDPLNSQSYNRYSYCMNNPIIYSDPSGYYWAIDKCGQKIWIPAAQATQSHPGYAGGYMKAGNQDYQGKARDQETERRKEQRDKEISEDRKKRQDQHQEYHKIRDREIELMKTGTAVPQGTQQYNTDGGEYEMDASTGKIKFVNGSDNDVIYITETIQGKTNRTGDKIEFDGKALMKDEGKLADGTDYQKLQFSTVNNGFKFFSEANRLTDVEWSYLLYIIYSVNRLDIYTIYKSDIESAGPTFAIGLKKEGATLIEFAHCHPEGIENNCTSIADREHRDKVLMVFPNANFRLYWTYHNKPDNRDYKGDFKNHNCGN